MIEIDETVINASKKYMSKVSNGAFENPKTKLIIGDGSEFVKKYKVYILATLCLIFFFRSCQKSGEIRKISKNNTESSTVVDSLNNVISVQKKTIDGIPQLIKDEKLKVHTEYDNYISGKNRGEQLMELHMVVKNNIKKLEN